jgi:pyruvate dehydrogenase phosphatase
MPRKTLEIDDYSNPYAPRRKVLQLLTPEECTNVLRAHEESYLVSRGNGVYRYDVNQIASNDPIEDDRVEQIIAAPNPSSPGTDNPMDVTKGVTDLKTGVKNATGEYGDWMFWALFDGHSGWYTSDLLKRQLVPYVVRELSNLYSQGKLINDTTPLQSPPSSLAVDQAIQRGFTALDDEIVLNSVKRLLKNPSKRLAADILLPANAGSCALLTFLDSQTGRLKVACTGDSRAILGRKDAKTGKWIVEVLSVDQTGNNMDEAKRIRKEHPGEERDVVRRGRVLGQLEPTRAVTPQTHPETDFCSSVTHGINSLLRFRKSYKNTGLVHSLHYVKHRRTSPPNPSSVPRRFPPLTCPPRSSSWAQTDSGKNSRTKKL